MGRDTGVVKDQSQGVKMICVINVHCTLYTVVTYYNYFQLLHFCSQNLLCYYLVAENTPFTLVTAHPPPPFPTRIIGN